MKYLSEATRRGMLSTFDIFPGNSRSQQRAELLADSTPERLLVKAWEDVGRSINSAMESYERDRYVRR